MHIGALIGLLLGGRLVQREVDRTAGTRIGNLTNGGGLAAAFDGTTSQASTLCALINTGTRTIGYAGKDWGVGVTKRLSGFIAYGSSDQGLNQIGTDLATVELQGSNDNFAAETVTLGTASAANAAGVVITKLTGITGGSYRYHRLKVTSASASTATDNKQFAEVKFYEDRAE